MGGKTDEGAGRSWGAVLTLLVEEAVLQKGSCSMSIDQLCKFGDK